MSCQHPRESCYFCGSGEDIESHHILPQRFGGGDTSENLVDVCHDCHWKIENLYNKNFWDKSGIKHADHTPVWDDKSVITVSWDVSESEFYDQEPEECAGCYLQGPFREVTHQPSGHPAWECALCNTVHVWGGEEDTPTHNSGEVSGTDLDSVKTSVRNAEEKYGVARRSQVICDLIHTGASTKRADEVLETYSEMGELKVQERRNDIDIIRLPEGAAADHRDKPQ